MSAPAPLMSSSPSRDSYLASPTISTCYCGALTWGGLRRRIRHLRVWVRRRVHVVWRREGAVLVGVRRLHRGHRRTLRGDGLRDGRDLLLTVRVSRRGRQRRIDCVAHGEVLEVGAKVEWSWKNQGACQKAGWAETKKATRSWRLHRHCQRKSRLTCGLGVVY